MFLCTVAGKLVVTKGITMGTTYKLAISVDIDENFVALDPDELQLTIARAVMMMHGRDGWNADEGVVKTVRIENYVYDPDTDTMIEPEHEYGIDADVIALIESHQGIQAIKLIRERTSLGLGEAKAVYDRYRDKHGIYPRTF